MTGDGERGLHQEGVISTGAETVDKIFGGGIPYRTLMLIEGEAASGKSALVQQFIWGALSSGEEAAVYITEQTVQAFIRQSSSLGLDISDYFLLDQLRVYPVSIPPDSVKPAIVFQRLADHLRGQSDCRVIVVDSLTTFVSRAGGDQIQEFFSRCKELCDGGKVIICTVHSDAFDQSILTRVRSVCDAHVNLKIERSATRLLTTMEVAKIRGAEVNTGSISSFEVDPGFGIRIVPMAKARA